MSGTWDGEEHTFRQLSSQSDAGSAGKERLSFRNRWRVRREWQQQLKEWDGVPIVKDGKLLEPAKEVSEPKERSTGKRLGVAACLGMVVVLGGVEAGHEVGIAGIPNVDRALYNAAHYIKEVADNHFGLGVHPASLEPRSAGLPEATSFVIRGDGDGGGVGFTGR